MTDLDKEGGKWLDERLDSESQAPSILLSREKESIVSQLWEMTQNSKCDLAEGVGGGCFVLCSWAHISYFLI